MQPRPLRHSGSGRKPVVNLKALIFLFMASAAGAEEALRLQLARQWEQSGELDRAAQELRLYLAEHPDDVAAYQWMGDLRLQLGRIPQAAESYKAGLQRDPGRSELRAKLASALEKSGDPVGAEAEWKKLAETAQDPALQAKAQEHLERLVSQAPLDKPTPPAKTEAVKPEAAKPKPEPVKAVAPEKPAAKPPSETPGPTSGAKNKDAAPTGLYAMPEFQAAVKQYQAGQKEQALKSLRAVLGKSAGHPGAYYLGGVIRYEMNEFDKAVYNFKRSFSYPEKGFNAHFYLGRIYQKQGKTREAIDAYEAYAKATQNESGRKQVQGYLDELKKKQPASAKPVAKEQPAPEPRVEKPASQETEPKAAAPKAIPAKPAASKPPVEHGTEHSRKSAPGHDSSESKQSAPAATAPEPKDSAGLGGKGMAYPIGGGLLFVVANDHAPGAKPLDEAREWLRREKIERAVQVLKATQVDFAASENGEVVPINLAAVYLKLGLWAQATAQAVDYLGHPGGRFERYAKYLQALGLIGQGQGKTAETLLQSVRGATGFGPPAEEVWYQLARAAASLGDPKRQAAYLAEAEKGLRDAPRLLWIRQQLGQFWAGQGDPGKAAQYYRKSLAACGDSVLSEACAESALRLADTEFRRRAEKEALAAYSDLLRRASQHKEAAWAQYQVGNLMKSGGDWDGALNAYQRVIDNYPYSYWAAQAKWQKEDAVWRKEYEGVLH